MADIQHADAVKALEVLREMITADPGARMSYSELCLALGRNPTKEGRYIGQVTSRIDSACFYADLPFLAMDKVRLAHNGGVNPKSFADPLWAPHRDHLAAIAENHVWTEDHFRKVAFRLRDLGDDSAKLIWQRINTRSEEAVRRALVAGGSTAQSDLSI